MNRLLIIFVLLIISDVVAAEPRPNILLIVSEDNGPELGCYGDPYARTPHLDRLAEQGIRFDLAYVPQAGCSQSRASFLTGLYPHQHGQIGLATWGFRLYREGIPNLPRSLKAVGYRSGILGKLHINPASAFPFDVHDITSANFARKSLGDYVQHAESFMTAGDAPFFLSVNFPDAHDPWIRQVDGLPKKPQTLAEVHVMKYMGVDPPVLREMVADYYNCLSRLDSLVGDLLSALKRSGKNQNTIVIYIGDHGADMLRGKRTCFEGGLRIPMLMRWPGRIVPQVRDELVSTIDLMPTLLAATGASAVDGLPGTSLQPLFEPGSPPWRSHLYAEYHTHGAALNYFPQRCVRNDRYKLIESLLPDTVHPDYDATIRKLHEDHKRGPYSDSIDLHASIANATKEVRAAYKLMRQPPRYQLYDLLRDPHEFRNLADSPRHAELLVDLKQRLTQWREATRDPLLDAENLRRLTAEVQSTKKKSDAQKRPWKYPTYLFDSSSSR